MRRYITKKLTRINLPSEEKSICITKLGIPLHEDSFCRVFTVLS